MTAITFTVTFTGSPDDFDVRGATRIVELENAKRTADGDVLPQLPLATDSQLKASYLEMLEAIITKAHANYIVQASDVETSVRDLWKNATDAERAAALTALGG
jgi:hypothetical protein